MVALPGGGRQDAGDDEISGHGLVDDDVGGTSLGDIGRQLREELLQFGGVGGDRYVAGVGVGGPVVESIDIHPVRAQQADAVDDDALGPGGGCDGGRGRTGGGLSVGEHDDDLVIAGAGVKEGDGLGEGIGMVGAPAS